MSYQGERGGVDFGMDFYGGGKVFDAAVNATEKLVDGESSKIGRFEVDGGGFVVEETKIGMVVVDSEEGVARYVATEDSHFLGDAEHSIVGAEEDSGVGSCFGAKLFGEMLADGGVCRKLFERGFKELTVHSQHFCLFLEMGDSSREGGMLGGGGDECDVFVAILAEIICGESADGIVIEEDFVDFWKVWVAFHSRPNGWQGLEDSLEFLANLFGLWQTMQDETIAISWVHNLGDVSIVFDLLDNQGEVSSVQFILNGCHQQRQTGKGLNRVRSNFSQEQ